MESAPVEVTRQVIAQNLSYGYSSDVLALQGVSMALAPGEFVALLGPNGSGKTTLAKHLNGLLRPDSGHVTVFGADTRRTRVAELAKQVGYVFQNPDHQIFSPTVREEIAFGPRVQGLDAATVSERVSEALGRFNLGSFAKLPPASLGFGQRRLVALAAVLATRPRLLILDEPTDGLDIESQKALMGWVTELQRQGGIVLLITHDMALAAEHATRTVALRRGRVLFDGSPVELFDRRDLLAEAELKVPPTRRLAERLRDLGIASDVLTPGQFAAAWLERYAR